MLVQSPDQPAAISDLIAAYDRLGDAEVAMGNHEQARAAFEQARLLAEKLAADNPLDVDAQRKLALSREKVASTLDASDSNKALEFQTKAFAIRRSVADNKPNDAELLREMGVSKEKIGDLLSSGKAAADASDAYREALALAQAALELTPESAAISHDIAVRNQKLGDLLTAAGDAIEAAENYQADYVITKGLVQKNPDRIEWLQEFVSSATRLANAKASTDLSGAAMVLEEATTFLSSYAPKEHVPVPLLQAWALALAKHAEYVTSLGDLAAARSGFQKAVAALQRAPLSDLQASKGTDDLTAIYDQASRFLNSKLPGDEGAATEALEYANRRLELVKLGSDKSRLERALGDQTWYALFARQYAKAIASAQEASVVASKEAIETPRWIAANRAHALMFADHTEEARALYLKYASDLEWSKSIIDDFAKFKVAGLQNVVMDEIGAKFSAGNQEVN